jgi:hypothetical protein
LSPSLSKVSQISRTLKPCPRNWNILSLTA